MSPKGQGLVPKGSIPPSLGLLVLTKVRQPLGILECLMAKVNREHTRGSRRRTTLTLGPLHQEETHFLQWVHKKVTQPGTLIT